MKQLILLVSFAIIGSLNAQEVVSTQGDSYSNGSGTIDFTIGEVVINTVTDGTYDMTQGFHQTNWNFVGIVDHAPNYEAVLFPNPTQDELNIRVSGHENVTFTLYDATGKIVMKNLLSGDLTTLDVSQIAPAAYSLILTDENQTKLKTFKLVKHH